MYSKITSNIDQGCVATMTSHHHFSKIARRYQYLRTTDTKPVALIAKELKELAHIEAIDVGCGTGRYDLLLCRYLGDRLQLTCCDANAAMLKTLDEYFKTNDVSNYTSIRSQAEHIPVPDSTFDSVFTFNAIHHFSLPEFLQESARILKSGRYLFIYTRLRDQNKNNIWGRYFPEFHQKETRLYTLETLKQTAASVPNLRIKSIESFKYKRIATLEQLIERARAKH